jgi:hypothetical protein
VEVVGVIYDLLAGVVAGRPFNYHLVTLLLLQRLFDLGSVLG